MPTDNSSVRSIDPTIIVCHLGYDSGAPMRAVIRGELPNSARAIVRYRDGCTDSLSIGPQLRVPGWHLEPWHVLSWQPTAYIGNLRIEVHDADTVLAVSPRFGIGPGRIQAQTISDVLYYFKAVRSSGEIDRKDAHAHFYTADPTTPTVDARGGWLDASGDQSKFLSHLTYTRMMSPQQIPLCAWAMMAADAELTGRHRRLGKALHARLRDEALFGADFLMRFQSPSGYFYTAIFDGLTKDLAERVITAPLQNSVRTTRYRAGYRHGGGLAIAALARAAGLDDHGEFTPEEYLSAAVRGLIHLEKHNTEYSFDSTESIIDDYCALLAATELVATSGRADAACSKVANNRPWRTAALRRARSLMSRYQPGVDGPGFLVGDAGGRPFFSAVEPGLPVIALLRFAMVFADTASDDAAEARELALQLCTDVIARTEAVVNPFDYPRSLVQPSGAAPQESFFFPHDNETGYWWQGENAGICSWSVAASWCANLAECPAELRTKLRRFASAQVNWVLGLNPFNVCMLQGRGRGNVEYSDIFQNVPGGILNGITSGLYDENDIAFMPVDPGASDSTWRWAEQWIPNAGWFLLATAAL